MSTVIPLVTTVDLCRTYYLGSEEINALRGINMTVMHGQFIAVIGRSGSGKTALLHIVAGSDKRTSGRWGVRSAGRGRGWLGRGVLVGLQQPAMASSTRCLR